MNAVLGGGLVVASLAFSSQLTNNSQLPKQLALQASVLVAATVWFAQAPARVAVPRWLWLWVALGALVVSGALRGNDVDHVLDTSLHWAFCGAAFALAVQSNREARAQHTLLRCIGASGAAIAMIGLLQHLELIAWAPEPSPPASTFGNRNWAAQVLAPCLPVIGVLAFAARSRVEAWLWPLALAVCAAFLVKIASTGAFMAITAEAALVAIGIALSPVLGRSIRSRLRSHAGPAALALVTFAAFALLEPGGFGLGAGVMREIDTVRELDDAPHLGVAVRGSGASSVRTRLAHYPSTLMLVSERPLFGHGLRDYSIEYLRANGELGDPARMDIGREHAFAHNDWMQIAVELGLPALMLWLAIPALGVWAGLRRLRTRDTPAPGVGFGLAAAAAVGGMGVHAAVSFPLYNAVPPYLGALCLAILLAPDARMVELPRALAPKARLAVLAVMAVAAIGWGSHVARAWYVDREMAQLQTAVLDSDWTAVTHRAESIRAVGARATDVLPTLALAQLATMQYDETLESLDELLAIHPYHPASLALRAATLDAASRLDEAAQAHAAALRVMPHRLAQIESAARSRIRSGDPKAAWIIVHDKLDSQELRTDLLLIAALIQDVLGDREHAIMLLEERLAAPPDSPVARAQLERLRARAQDSTMIEPD